MFRLDEYQKFSHPVLKTIAYADAFALFLRLFQIFSNQLTHDQTAEHLPSSQRVMLFTVPLTNCNFNTLNLCLDILFIYTFSN